MTDKNQRYKSGISAFKEVRKHLLLRKHYQDLITEELKRGGDLMFFLTSVAEIDGDSLFEEGLLLYLEDIVEHHSGLSLIFASLISEPSERRELFIDKKFLETDYDGMLLASQEERIKCLRSDVARREKALTDIKKQAARLEQLIEEDKMKIESESAKLLKMSTNGGA